MMAILLCIKCYQAHIADSETHPIVDMSLASQEKSVIPLYSETTCDIPVIVIAPGEQVIWSWCSACTCRLLSVTCELSCRMHHAACLERVFLQDSGDPSYFMDKQVACSQWLSVRQYALIFSTVWTGFSAHKGRVRLRCDANSCAASHWEAPCYRRGLPHRHSQADLPPSIALQSSHLPPGSEGVKSA